MAAREQSRHHWRRFTSLGLVLVLGLLAGCDLSLPTLGLAEVPSPTPSPTPTPLRPAPTLTSVPGGTVLRVEPASLQIVDGATAPADIVIDNVVDLWGVEFQLQFDPALLQVQDADPDTGGVQIQVGSFLSPDYVARNQVDVDNEIGVVTYALTQWATEEPASGGGQLASITFQGASQGSSVLTFTVVKLSANQGQRIPATPEAGQVVVIDGDVGSAATPPTPTPPSQVTPTLTPEVTAIRTAPPSTCDCYVVKRGDTLFSIARRYGVSMWKLAAYNNIRNPNRIYVGQVIDIPPR
jgi:LysM repeat protein